MPGMERATQVAGLLSELTHASPAGYAIALHVTFATPSFLFQTYPAEWSAYYSVNGLVIQDPTVQWGMQNVGHVDWADLAADDPADVLGKARAHGLRHGFSFALIEGDSRSIAGFARGDRPFTAQERAEISAKVTQLHTLTANPKAMPKAVADALHALAVNQSQRS